MSSYDGFRIVFSMAIGAIMGLPVGAVAAAAIGRGRTEPERFLRPCLIMGAIAGAIAGLLWVGESLLRGRWQ